MNYQAILEQVRQHVITFFDTHTDERLVYHNKPHTEGVVAAAIQIANHYQLDEKDFFIVVTAAWFHDLGYFMDATVHEQKGAEAAVLFLKDKGIDEGILQTVRGCILATRMPQQPVTLLEKIVCDADLFHLGTDAFAEKNKLLRKEYMAMHQTRISKEDWRRGTIQLLETHHYHTDYCRLLLNDRKRENLEKLQKKEMAKEPIAPPAAAVTQQPVAPPATKQKSKTRPDRGIETMFRISSANHQRLSDMADSKAHIMITVNSIIISVLLSVLLRKLEEYPHLTIPALMLLAVNLITIIFSILATRPNIPQGTFTNEDIKAKRVNLLFFGNFYRMSLEEYSSGMLQMMEDRDFLYGSLIRDVYSQGVVLGRKYRMLRVSYNVFMYGLIVAVIAFVIASIIHSGT